MSSLREPYFPLLSEAAVERRRIEAKPAPLHSASTSLEQSILAALESGVLPSAIRSLVETTIERSKVLTR